jgi:glycosyltransferase involved in cell wall biosynthesis
VDISIVIPIYNEEENIPALHESVTAALAGSGLEYELILVDDGSSDGSFALLQGVAGKDPRVKVIRFRRNFGQTAAMAAGFNAAVGRVVVPMDGDLQNDPADIPRLVDALHDADAAAGRRVRRHDTWLKRASSRVANGIRNWITREAVSDSACTLRAIRRECVTALPPFDGMHRFVPTLLRIGGYRVREVPVAHRARRFGESKFGVRNRAGRAFRDLLVVRWMQHRALRYSVEPDP